MNYCDYDPVLMLAEVRPENRFDGINPSLEDSITFAHDPEDIAAGFRGQRNENFHIYGRFSHPSLYFLGRQFSAIEDADFALCLASGQACAALILHSLLDRGDHVVVSNRLYGGTVSLLDDAPRSLGIRVTRVDITNLDAVKKALKIKRTKLLFVESVSNPSLVACDIGKLGDLAHTKGAYLAVDNTFMPLAVLPLRLGADLSMHSLTKFGNGQSDGLGGIVCVGMRIASDTQLLKRMQAYLNLNGPVMNHTLAHEISKRISHLRIRFREGSHSAQAVAEGLARRGIRVHYPSLEGYAHTDAMNAILRTRELGYGAVLAADFVTGEAAMQFARNLDAAHGGYSAVSLGSAHTYVCAPLASVHCAQHDKEVAGTSNHRAPPELTPGLVRIACGYELPPELQWKKVEAAIPR
jgi:methionine-gamma-lyase